MNPAAFVAILCVAGVGVLGGVHELVCPVGLGLATLLLVMGIRYKR